MRMREQSEWLKRPAETMANEIVIMTIGDYHDDSPKFSSIQEGQEQRP
jgi:hypothetical protein